MAEHFYHVDETGDLSVEDTMTLEWPPRVAEDVSVRSPADNEATLRKLYPEGLSIHGARYAQSELICRDDVALDPGWEAMSGAYDYHDTGQAVEDRHHTVPYQVVYEWVVELVRRAEFPDARSRFQSFFAMPSLEAARAFRREHRHPDAEILEVTCDSHAIRDMSLVESAMLGTGTANARQYWRGEAGSSEPAWEVAMAPPVRVVDRVSARE